MKTFLYSVMTGENNSLLAGLMRPLLFILSFVYRAGVRVIYWLYEAGILKSVKVDKPVISIGNITAGGVGKTPFVIFLAKYLYDRMKHPVILTRGYMDNDDALSDEAMMMRQVLPQVPVVVSPDRVLAAREALHDHIVDVFLLDDGFQHWKMARDLDVVLIDAANPFGNGQLLPAGILREPLEALERAHIFVITRADIAKDLPALRGELNRRNPQATIAEITQTPVSLSNLFTNEVFKDFSPLKGRVLACAAIGAPRPFLMSLEKLGATVEHAEIFNDHYVYNPEDIQKMVSICREKKIKLIATTHKDAVKMINFQNLFGDVSVIVVNIAVNVIRGENELFSRINSVLSS
ncbi:MAG: tetraacyldisaccharide 4'-kinase [Candidatus Omnitrophica bacterium]|nr:tetraacyldisaccharide 4'-kinase [Candidatus Omnitrophota bacterium]